MQINKKLIIAATLAVLASSPLLALAQADTNYSMNSPGVISNLGVGDLITIIFSVLWPVAIAFFIIMFILASFTFFTAHGDEAKLAAARNEIIWGVVGVVVALLAFSIPTIVKTTLNNAPSINNGL